MKFNEEKMNWAIATNIQNIFELELQNDYEEFHSFSTEEKLLKFIQFYIYREEKKKLFDSIIAEIKTQLANAVSRTLYEKMEIVHEKLKKLLDFSKIKAEKNEYINTLNMFIFLNKYTGLEST